MKKSFICIFVIMFFTSLVLIAEPILSEPDQNPESPYRLFKTQNVWTFIKLDTRTGQMWQLHFDVQGESRGTLIINNNSLITDKDIVPGRFTLYPTSNIFTFILLDQIDGRTWQAQWAFEAENRGIIAIN